MASVIHRVRVPGGCRSVRRRQRGQLRQPRVIVSYAGWSEVRFIGSSRIGGVPVRKGSRFPFLAASAEGGISRPARSYEAVSRVIRSVVPARTVEGGAQTSRLPQRQSGLPAEVSSLVGRGPEIAAVLERLRSGRVVTLTGPGGCGKTRLALRVAALAEAGFGDGARLVELAPLTDPALVPASVAQAAGRVRTGYAHAGRRAGARAGRP